MAEAPGGDAVPDLGELQVALRRAVRTAIRSCSEPHGLSVEEFALLNALRMGGPNPVSRVARALNFDPPSVSRNAYRLTEDGLIASERSSTDRRVVMLSLTDRGAATAREIDECVGKAYGDLVAGAAPGEIDGFVKTIQHIRENFRRIWEREDR